MEQEEVIRRLKGLGRATTPAAPDFGTQNVPLAARSGRARFGIAPIAAVVGVLALGTAALAVPQGAPLRQVVAGLTTEIETDVAEVDAELDADKDGASGSVLANPCEGPPPVPTSTTVVETPDAVEGGASVEVSPEDRSAQVEAWKEWRSKNCGPEADRTDDDADDSGEPRRRGHGESNGKGERGQSGDNPPATHPHEDDPCKGPPPHANRPGNGDDDRDAEERRAQQEAWNQWHRENCPPGQTGEHQGQGRPDGAGKPDDAGRPDGAGKPDHAGRPDDAGRSGEEDGS